jgi:hypothetical protein
VDDRLQLLLREEELTGSISGTEIVFILQSCACVFQALQTGCWDLRFLSHFLLYTRAGIAQSI